MKKSNQLRFRWHGGAFYEFLLPNGKIIVTDPFQYHAGRCYLTDGEKQACDVVEGCDYILLTHTHFDHARDLPEMVRKFPESIVIVADDGYASLMMEQGYNPLRSRIQPVGDRDRLELPDFRLEAFRGKHTIIGLHDPALQKVPEVLAQGIPFREQKLYRDKEGAFDLLKGLYDVEAGMAFRNYKLTFPGGETVLIWGGEIAMDFRKHCYYGMKPDLLFIQLAATNVGGDRDHPQVEAMTDFIRQIAPKAVVPMHQENFEWELLEKIASDCNQLLQQERNGIRYYNPESSIWYTVRATSQNTMEINRD